MTPRKDTEETGSQTSVSLMSALNTAGTETADYILHLLSISQSACQTSELPLTAHKDANSHESLTTPAGGLAMFKLLVVLSVVVQI